MDESFEMKFRRLAVSARAATAREIRATEALADAERERSEARIAALDARKILLEFVSKEAGILDHPRDRLLKRSALPLCMRRASAAALRLEGARPAQRHL